MKLKKDVMTLIENILTPWPGKEVSIIICKEYDGLPLSAMFGARHEGQNATVMVVDIDQPTIKKFMGEFWDLVNRRRIDGTRCDD